MFVKLMGENGKACSVHEVASCIFHEREDVGGWWVTLTTEVGDIKQVQLEGNAYLMNNYGVTFDRFILPCPH